MDFVTLFEQGGPVLGVLALISVIALAVFIERLMYLRQNYHLPKRLLKALRDINTDREAEVIDLLKSSNRPLSYLVLRLLEYRHMTPREATERMRGPMDNVHKQLVRGVDLLSTVASISPLLGLLGTVLGMMHVFQTINLHGLGNPSHLAGGISEALITTIGGLLVAIPAFVAHKMIRARSSGLMHTIESYISGVYEKLYHQR